MNKGALPLSEPAFFDDASRRDFLNIATASAAAVGSAVAIWPFIDQMNPSADMLSLSVIEIDLSPIETGQRMTVKWRGKPVFVEHRTPTAIDAARAEDDAILKDPERDVDRVHKAEWLVLVGVCTHLGCIPLGQAQGAPRGDWDGWFCPCHGSHYDQSGRIRKGPAPRNLDIPPYRIVGETVLQIG